MRGNADAATVESAEGNLQALAFFAKAVFARDFAVVEKNFDSGGAALAHFVFMAADFEAGKARLDQKGGDAFAARFGIGLGKDDEEAGDAAVRDPGLCAVQAIDIAARSAERCSAPGCGCCGCEAGRRGRPCSQAGADLLHGDARGLEFRRRRSQRPVP